ncbi:MAG: RNA polymerase sigma factor [Lachnospiraceae bacterium]
MAGFSGFYKEYVSQVYHFLLKLTRDPALAEELTQETFYQAFLHIDRFEGKCQVFTWLCQIGKKAYYKEIRRRKRQVSMEESMPGVGENAGCEKEPLEDICRQEQLERMKYHLSHLPEPYREVFTMRIFGEVSFKELAGLYGKSESWARVTCYRAKEQIMKRLEEDEHENKL